VTRIVNILPAVVDALPVCLIRSTCRWYEQEGHSACVRCPQVVTELADPTDDFRRAALGERGAQACRPICHAPQSQEVES
jgi:hypothetical protein